MCKDTGEESMKVRDSGMPEEEMWAGFFDPAKVLSIFGLDEDTQDLVEFGCGYGRNYDPSTPRGPAMEIRPSAVQCIEWGKMAGFCFNEQDRYDLPPYHFGLLFRKPFA